MDSPTTKNEGAGAPADGVDRRGDTLDGQDYLGDRSFVSSDHRFGIVVTLLATVTCIYFTMWIIVIPIFEPPETITKYFPDVALGVAAPLAVCSVLLLFIAAMLGSYCYYPYVSGTPLLGCQRHEADCGYGDQCPDHAGALETRASLGPKTWFYIMLCLIALLVTVRPFVDVVQFLTVSVAIPASYMLLAELADRAPTRSENTSDSTTTESHRTTVILSDRTEARSDEVRPKSHRTTAKSDETKAKCDNTTAESGKSTAESDHTTARSNHVTIQSDDVTAKCSQVAAGSNETRTESYRTTAESDQTAAKRNKTTAKSGQRTAKSDEAIAISDRTPAKSGHMTAECNQTRTKSNHMTVKTGKTVAKSKQLAAKSDTTAV